MGSSVALCAVDTDWETVAGALACWTVDVASGALAARAAEVFPGLGVDRRLQRGCTDGYCVPDQHFDSALVARSTDGKQVAVLTSGTLDDPVLTFTLFKAGSHQRVQSFTVSPDHSASRWPQRLYFVDDVLHVVVSDGRWGRVGLRVRADGTHLDAWQNRDASDGFESLLYGNVVALDAGHVGFVSSGLRALRVYPTAGGEPTTVNRGLPPHPCELLDLGFMASWSRHPGCEAFIERELAPYADVSLVALPEGGYLGVTYAGELVWFDAALTPTRRSALPQCAR